MIIWRWIKGRGKYVVLLALIGYYAYGRYKDQNGGVSLDEVLSEMSLVLPEDLPKGRVVWYLDESARRSGGSCCQLRLSMSEEEFRTFLEENGFQGPKPVRDTAFLMEVQSNGDPDWWSPSDLVEPIFSEKHDGDLYWCAVYGENARGRRYAYVVYF